MLDLAPVAHILGLVVAVLGLAMVAPAGLDFANNDENWQAFFKASIEACYIGGLIAMATRPATPQPLGLRQAYLLTALIWLLLPLFAALPFIHGAPGASLTDAYFEAASGITTTGSSVFLGIEQLPRGVLLWRGMLNWMGGLGIVFVAMIFLPVMRVGGMQFFRTEGFDTLGKILPRAGDISKALLWVYVGLTVLFGLTYRALGMSGFDALVHAMSTVATGGFSTYDASFAAFSGPLEYAGALFMLISAMPFILYVQLARGVAAPLWRDSQVRAFLRWCAYAVAAVTAWRLINADAGFEQVFRETAFNLVSIMTGTGFGSSNVGAWGSFPVVVAFLVGMIGGCTGSSSGALSVFRWQVLIVAITTAVRRLHSPNRLVIARYDGKRLDDDTLNPLMFYFFGYIFITGILTVALSMTGVDFESSVFGVWTSINNIGFALGPLATRTGTMVDYNDAAIWIMSLAMLLGRLGLLAILVVVLPRFWRN